ncbi:nitrate reductase molybdenum cofactor assembly chaperone [Nocardiopsis sp. CNT312]|uniref:nitrate reductase molybdenum cofactor assembly chaperone n=1 Tax=Nocardiopsis sp. CNT312 TaxID=1137268 RepID=UPI0004B645FE|nr:nitrate reductase molybdenum cofactor assembly chaperone [Nocardiopsis sp. CNT312]
MRSRDEAVVRQAASLLLGYPDQVWRGHLPGITQAVGELPRGGARAALAEFCDHAACVAERELCEHYVDVFDLRHRRSLHMTYYSEGSTRRRGHALVEIGGVYTAAGWKLTARELPDHLAVVLEFTARGDARAGEALLARLRPGLELLRAALHDHGTPYARVVDAVHLTLPPGSGRDRERARRLAAQGPPAEDVGLEPYGAGTPLPLTDVSGRSGEGAQR